MPERMVHCVKLGREAPGLTAPPFGGEMGQEIFNKVSAEAWGVWQNDLMIKVINEYRLDMSNTEHYNALLKQMRAYLNLDEGGELLEVENATRGKGSGEN